MDYTKEQCLRRIKQLDLLDEAYKKYKGKKVKCLHGSTDYDGVTELKISSDDCIRHNSKNGCGCVYDPYRGWATIIEEPKIPEYTMEELTEKLGHTFKIKIK